MTVRIIARPPILPNTSPPAQITGDFSYANITGQPTYDIFSLVFADILPILSSFNRNFSYQIRWGFVTELSSSIPNNISAFAGTPTRYNFGNVTLGCGIFQQRYENINYQKQQINAGIFLFENVSGRVTNIADVGSGATIATNFIVAPNANTYFDTQCYTGNTHYDYVDTCNFFFYSGATFNLKIAYDACSLGDEPTTLSIRRSPL